jgi:hypothetical protein
MGRKKMTALPKKIILALPVFFLIFSIHVKADEIKPGSGQETHKVIKGDTLWDLSDDFYRNNFLWPVLWSRNPEITNPHFIYPDDKLNLMPVERKKRVIEKVIIQEVIKEIPYEEVVIVPPPPEEVVEIEPIPEKVEPPKEKTIADLLGTNVLATAGYFTFTTPEKLALVQGGIAGRQLMEKGSLAYINKGFEHGVKKGDAFTIVSIAEGPASKDAASSGYIVKILGELVIDEVLSDNQSKALVTEDYAEIQRGNILISTFKVDGTAKINTDVPDIEGLKIIATKDEFNITGNKNIVYLNKGAEDGLKAGHKFNVFRKGYLGKHASIKDAVTSFPEEKVGEVTVLYTTENTATAVVSSNSREIMIADKVKKEK